MPSSSTPGTGPSHGGQAIDAPKSLARVPVVDGKEVDAILDRSGSHELMVARKGRVPNKRGRVQYQVAVRIPRELPIQLRDLKGSEQT